MAVVLLTAGPALASGMESYYPGDLGQALASVLTFVVLLLVLRKWAWKPIVTQLQHREKAITEALAKAEQREQEADDLLALYKARLARAEIDAEDLLVGSRKAATEMREQAVDIAKTEARKGTEQAREDIERAKHEALRELRDTTAEMASEIAGRVIRKQLTPEDKQRLIDGSMEEIRKKTSEQ